MINLTLINFILAQEQWMFNKISNKIKIGKFLTQDQLWDQAKHYHKKEVYEVRGEKTVQKVSEAETHFVVSEHVLVLS